MARTVAERMKGGIGARYEYHKVPVRAKCGHKTHYVCRFREVCMECIVIREKRRKKKRK